MLAGNSGRLKTVITDQKVIAGIGNAYSDEILHVAKLSPFATASKLSGEQISTLHDAMVSVLTDAVSRSVGQQAATLKGEKRSGLRVHDRTGLPCPVCGDTVREVSFADKSFQYCPTCQTGGRCWPTAGCRGCSSSLGVMPDEGRGGGEGRGVGVERGEGEAREGEERRGE